MTSLSTPHTFAPSNVPSLSLLPIPNPLTEYGFIEAYKTVFLCVFLCVPLNSTLLGVQGAISSAEQPSGKNNRDKQERDKFLRSILSVVLQGIPAKREMFCTHNATIAFLTVKKNSRKIEKKNEMR